MPAPVTIDSIDGLESYVGKALGTTDWLQIDQARIQTFADATGDQQWIHVDIERAKRESPFEGPVAHGYLTLSLIPALLPQLMLVEKVSAVVNTGIEKIRFASPVPAGGRVRLSAEIAHFRRLPGGGARVSIAVTLEVEGAVKPACAGTVIYVYFP